ncbi:hypothetical protein [Bradyrhizobium sp. WD16]|uniref:hypothetical protein n=1 Tax=Bradyrhizobium sp. WD16 TaxID=1521768 RepID=UPI0020A32475|nr:hypothetical protein [Bradyrhizobium sp. WD16]UTD28512.1 hypothetical protein DB459_18005 [Bradyrhizobium sp. WD16]
MRAQLPATLPGPPALLQHEHLRIVLLAVTMIKAISTLGDAAGLFGGIDGMAALTVLALALDPLCAIAAFILTLQGRLSGAICALAAIIVLNWFSDMVPVVLHGFDTAGSLSLTLVMELQIVGYPLIAACAIALALRAERLIAATILVILPMVVSAGSLVAFAIGVAIYRF